MKRLLILLAALATLSACAAEKPPVLASATRYKSVAIMVAVPARIGLRTTGMFVFDNDNDVVDVPDWHLSSVALDAANRALEGHYKVAYTINDEQFKDPDVPVDALFRKTSSIQDFAKVHARADLPVDLIIVLCESYSVFPATVVPPVIEYIGVFKVRDPILTRPPVVHSYVSATMMDGKTYKVITETPLLLPPHKRQSMGLFGNAAWGVGGGYPEELLEGFEWKDHWRDLTEDQQKLIHDRIIYLLSTSTLYTLQTTLTTGGS